MEKHDQLSRLEQKEISELSVEAKEIIKIFQEARKSNDPHKQVGLFQDFYNHLMKTVTPENKSYFKVSDHHLIDILLRGDKHSYNYLSVGGGTSGQRIFFLNNILVPKDKDPHKYGPDLKPEKFQGTFTLDSGDGRPRWMCYWKPEGNDWLHGQEYWEKFVNNFGDSVVDLFQNIKIK